MSVDPLNFGISNDFYGLSRPSTIDLLDLLEVGYTDTNIWIPYGAFIR